MINIFNCMIKHNRTWISSLVFTVFQSPTNSIKALKQ